MKKIAIVTGAAGFIGSHLIQRLLQKYSFVYGIDDLSLGNEKNLLSAMGLPNFNFFPTSIADFQPLSLFPQEDPSYEFDLWHFAANSDILAGARDFRVDLQKTFMTTVELISAFRPYKIKRVLFSSTSAVYGEREGVASAEDSGPLYPISTYGAMKLASEAFLSAQAEVMGFQLTCFRFPNVVGSRLTHGILFDFFKKVQRDSATLEVLGNGTQTKQYLLVAELLDAIELIVAKCNLKRGVYNIGPGESFTSVREIAEIFVRKVCPSASICYGNSDRGWVGDVPKFRLNIDKVKSLGWVSKIESTEAVSLAIDALLKEGH